MPYRLLCNYENTPNDHKGVVGTPAGGVIYRPGKFGQGVQVAEATTNLVPNPSFEVDVSGWTSGAVTVTNPTGGVYGSKYASIVGTSVNGSIYTTAVITVTGSTSYTVSFWYRNPSSHSVRFRLYDYTTPADLISVTLPNVTEWTRYVATVTTASTTTQVRLIFDVIDLGESIDLDAIQLEAKIYATPYCDGSLGAGHSWSGTTHASISVRTGASLTYPITTLDPAEGAVSVWVNVAAVKSSSQGIFFAGNANGQFDGVFSSGYVYFRMAGVNLITATPDVTNTNQWYHLLFAWSASQNWRGIYVNGVLKASRQYDTGSAMGTSLCVYWGSTTDQALNGVGDQFAVIDRAITAAEVARIYNGGAGLDYYEFLYALATAADFTTSVRLNGTWVDITAYTQAANFDLGFSGAYEVIARGETLSLALLNRDRRFSPENPTGAYYPYFTKNADVKVDVTQDGVTKTMFYGQIDLIEPDGDTLGNRTAKVECIGLLNRLQNIMVNIGVQENKRADEIVASILHDCNFTANVTGVWRLGVTGYTELNTTAILGESKEIFEYERGETTFAVVGDDWTEDTSAYGAIRDVVGQEYGRLWVNRGGAIQILGQTPLYKKHNTCYGI